MRVMLVWFAATLAAFSSAAAQQDTTRCTWEGRLPERGVVARPASDASDIAPLVERSTRGSKVERQLAVRELGGTANPAALPALVRALADTNRHIAVEAAWALGRLGATSVEPTLLDATRRDDAHIVQAAVCSLGRVGTNASLPRLQSLIASSNPFVASAADWSVRQIRALPTLPRE